MATGTVYVWNPQNKHPGHVSLEINSTYISWGPTEFHKAKAHKPYTAHGHGSTLKSDSEVLGTPHQRMKVHGLDAADIKSYWEVLGRGHLNYHLSSTSCAGIVASALLMGSGYVVPSFKPKVRARDYGVVKASVAKLLAGSDVWTPPEVYRYAAELNSRWNPVTKRIEGRRYGE